MKKFIPIILFFVFIIPTAYAQVCNDLGSCCQNIPCNFTVSFTNSTSGSPITNGACNISATNVNTTSVFQNQSMSHLASGIYNFSWAFNYTGAYTYTSTCWIGTTMGSQSDSFDVVAIKRFLMEIYLMFEFVALFFFVMGFRKEGHMYPSIAMVMFFALAASGFISEGLFFSDSGMSIEAVGFNFMFGMLSLIYMMLSIFGYFKPLMERVGL